MPWRSIPNTTRRCSSEVELYKWKMTLGRTGQGFHGALNELLARLAEHLDGDAIGNAAFVDDAANEVKVRAADAAGKPTSISAKPTSSSRSNMRSFSCTFIGSIRAWLPSRRSTLHQRGARSKVRPGHCRSGRSMGANGRYLWNGIAPPARLRG